MNKKIPNTDTTYCTNKKCCNKCWRNIENYRFDENINYWFTAGCIEKEGKKDGK